MPTRIDPQEQVKKDRKTLLKGALVAGAGGAAVVAMLRKSRGGVVGGAGGGNSKLQIPRSKGTAGASVKAATGSKGALGNSVKRYGDAGAVERQVKAGDLRAQRAWGATRPVSSERLAKLTPEGRKKYGELVGQTQTAKGKYPAGQVTAREASAGDRGARQKARQALAGFRRSKGFEDGGRSSDGGGRMFEVEQPRKRGVGEGLKNVAVAGGAIASGAAAVHGAREWKKTNGAVRELLPKLEPKQVVREGVKEVGRKAGEFFPTLGKLAKAMKKRVLEGRSRLTEFGGKQQWKEEGSHVYADPLKAAAGLQKVYHRKDGGGNPIVEDLPIAHAQTVRAALRRGEKVNRVATRAGRLGKDVVDTVRGKPRDKDAAGRPKKKEWEKGYFREGVKKAAAGAAVLGYYGALRKSPGLRANHQKAVKWVAKKANEIVPDLVPRTGFEVPSIEEVPSANGRHLETAASALFEFEGRSNKEKEEKKTLRAARLRNGLVGAAAGAFLGGQLHGGASGYKGARIGAGLGAAYGVLSNPKRRAAIDDLQTAAFESPASEVFHFDEVASAAGWDVRDPRGKSARVFAPGSRKRVRREKEWYEEVGNERKIRNAAAVLAGAGGLAAGVAIGKRMKKPAANVVKFTPAKARA